MNEHRLMGWTRGLALILALLIIVGITLAWRESSLASGWAALTSNPWGWVTLLDLYAGLVFVAAWIAATLRRPGPVLGWALALLLLGHLATALYILWRSGRVKSWEEFLTGKPLVHSNLSVTGSASGKETS